VPVSWIEPSSNETSPLEVFQSLVDLPEIKDPEWTNSLFENGLDDIAVQFPVGEESQKCVAKQHESSFVEPV